MTLEAERVGRWAPAPGKKTIENVIFLTAPSERMALEKVGAGWTEEKPIAIAGYHGNLWAVVTECPRGRENAAFSKEVVEPPVNTYQTAGPMSASDWCGTPPPTERWGYNPQGQYNDLFTQDNRTPEWQANQAALNAIRKGKIKNG